MVLYILGTIYIVYASLSDFFVVHSDHFGFAYLSDVFMVYWSYYFNVLSVFRRAYYLLTLFVIRMH